MITPLGPFSTQAKCTQSVSLGRIDFGTDELEREKKKIRHPVKKKKQKRHRLSSKGDVREYYKNEPRKNKAKLIL